MQVMDQETWESLLIPFLPVFSLEIHENFLL